MLWKTIKKILQKQGGKCIIVEENEPAYLVMKIDDYEETLDKNQSSEVEKVNEDINEWKEKEDKQVEIPETEADNQAVKVEDLPF